MEIKMSDKEVRKKNAIYFDKPSLTKQNFKESCDVNYILKKYQKTGILPLADKVPMWGDFSNVKSYQESMNIVMKAEAQFSALPSNIRKRFGNDPSQFLEFMDDDGNIEEAVELGLKSRPNPPADNAGDSEVKKEAKRKKDGES